MNVRLTSGRWYAGIDTPFGASDSMIRAKLAEYGFTNVQIHERDEASLPAGIIPSSDDWDKWGSADYSGQPKTIELHDAVTWTIAPTGSAITTPTEPPTEPPKPKRKTAGIGWLALVFLWLIRGRGGAS